MTDERRSALLTLIVVGASLLIFVMIASLIGRVGQVEADVRRVCMLTADDLGSRQLRDYCVLMYEDGHGGTGYGGSYESP